MTAAELAAKLDGKDFMTEMPEDDARENRLFIVFGYSDDLIEIRGFQDEEIYAFSGETFYINPETGYVAAEEGDETEYFKNTVSNWGKVYGEYKNRVWEFETKIPHSTFNLYDEDDLFCKGIVFSMDDLTKED